jgi:GT2 family glycosyltransferase
LSDTTTNAPADWPFISVVIPTRARPLALKRCLEALLAQDYPVDRYEIHVVHNASPDGTEEVVREMAAGAGVPLTYTWRAGNGPGLSRRVGGMKAAGDILAFIDDDCVATPGWLRAGVAAFGPRTGLVQGRTAPNPAHKRRLLEKTVNVPGPSPYFETCNIFYRKDAFLEASGEAGPFAELFFGEDTDLARRVLREGYEAAFAADALAYHDVTRQPLVKWLMECWHLRNIPLLVRLWPEMRETLFLGVFLSRQSAAFDLAVVGGLLGAPFIGGWALLFVLPYLLVRMLEPGRYRNPPVVIARALLGLPRSCVTFAALVYGSIRHRALVL